MLSSDSCEHKWSRRMNPFIVWSPFFYIMYSGTVSGSPLLVATLQSEAVPNYVLGTANAPPLKSMLRTRRLVESDTKQDENNHDPIEMSECLSSSYMIFFLMSFLGAGILQLIVSKITVYTIPISIIWFLFGMALTAIVYIPSTVPQGCGAMNSNSEKKYFLFLGVWYISKINADVIYLILLPILLYDASLHIKWHHFKRFACCGITLAVFGVAYQVAVIGFFFSLTFSNDYSDSEDFLSTFQKTTPNSNAYLITSAMASTDPVAVLSVLQSLQAPVKLSTMFEGESLINDGTSVLLFQLFKALASGHVVTWYQIAIRFFSLLCLAPIWGYAAGVVVYHTIRYFRRYPDIQAIIMIATGYFVYLYGEKYILTNGPIAIVCYGLYYTSFGHTGLGRQGHNQHLYSVHVLAQLANISIFIIAGAVTMRMLWETITSDNGFPLMILKHIPIFYIYLILGRASMVIFLLPLLRRVGYGINGKEVILLIWGGLRGAIVLAMGMMIEQEKSIPPFIRYRCTLYIAGTVLLLLIINGVSFELLFRYLNPYPPKPFRRMYLEEVMKHTCFYSSLIYPIPYYLFFFIAKLSAHLWFYASTSLTVPCQVNKTRNHCGFFFIDRLYYKESTVLQNYWLFKGSSVLQLAHRVVPKLGCIRMNKQGIIHVKCPRISSCWTHLLEEIHYNPISFVASSSDAETGNNLSQIYGETPPFENYLYTVSSSPDSFNRRCMLSFKKHSKKSDYIESKRYTGFWGLKKRQKPESTLDPTLGSKTENDAKIFERFYEPHNSVKLNAEDYIRLLKRDLSGVLETTLERDQDKKEFEVQALGNLKTKNLLNSFTARNRNRKRSRNAKAHTPQNLVEECTGKSKDMRSFRVSSNPEDDLGVMRLTCIQEFICKSTSENLKIHQSHRHQVLPESTPSMSPNHKKDLQKLRDLFSEPLNTSSDVLLQSSARTMSLESASSVLCGIDSTKCLSVKPDANHYLNTDSEQGFPQVSCASQKNASGRARQKKNFTSSFTPLHHSFRFGFHPSLVALRFLRQQNLTESENCRKRRSLKPFLKPILSRYRTLNRNSSGRKKRSRVNREKLLRLLRQEYEGELYLMVFNTIRAMYRRLYEQHLITGASMRNLDLTLDSAVDFSVGKLRHNFTHGNKTGSVPQVSEHSTKTPDTDPHCGTLSTMTGFELEWQVLKYRLQKTTCRSRLEEWIQRKFSHSKTLSASVIFQRVLFYLQQICAYVDVHEDLLYKGGQSFEALLGPQLLASYLLQIRRAKNFISHFFTAWPQGFPYALAVQAATLLIHLKQLLVQEQEQKGLLLEEDSATLRQVLQEQHYELHCFRPLSYSSVCHSRPANRSTRIRSDT